MIDIQNASVGTAGAYICMSGLYLFAIGNQLHNGCIPVFRLGGHRENMKLAGNAHANRKQSRLTIQSLQHI
jgi:hypothetical protein